MSTQSPDGTQDEKRGTVSTMAASDLEKKPVSHWDPSQFPDGGLQAWLVVAGAFCFVFCSFGWINCIGIFQETYQNGYLSDYSASSISWIASLELFIMFFGGLFIGRIYDMKGPRWILLFGSVLHIFGLMMVSLSTQYYQILLSQGVASAIGISCLFNPSMSCVTTWFFKKRAYAIGIVASGSSLGGVILPIMFTRLQAEYGFPWAMRICAFFMLGLLIFANIVTKSRIPPAPRPVTIRTYFKPLTEKTYLIMTIGLFVFYLGVFIPINYIETQALELDMNPDLANYLIPILNGASMFGRILPGFVADKWGRFNTVAAMSAGAGIVTLAVWLPAKGNAPLIVFAALYGFFSGAGVSLIAAMVAQISDLQEIGTRLGMEFAVLSFAALVANPIGGAFIAYDNGGYTSNQIWAGITLLAGAVIVFVSRLTQSGKKLIAVY